MALTPGARLGVYEITAAIGEGGMGQVYRATDTTLSRHVAIKILPDAFAQDAERLARFEREAKTLASLNHPNIAAIYGFEQSSGLHALVMELVEGDDLSQRIAKGAIGLDEALPIAKQIAEALEAAHEQGIIHRDLKPANIKVRPDGTVKVLDFGLARAMEPTGAMSASNPMSPTITTPAMTQAGMILGTAAYMSPEQAAGKSADKRSDLWSFGVVLLEMLTGARVFTGETVSHVLASVLRAEPDWATLPPDTPPSVGRLLRRCLEKDRRRRLDSAAAASLELEEARTPPVSETGRVPAPRRIWEIALAAVMGGALVAAVALSALTRPAPPPVAGQTRFVIQPSAALPLDTGVQYAQHNFAVAPDGSFLVYVAGDQRRLVVRWFDRLDAVPIEGVTGAQMPFVSADSRWIGFQLDDFTIRKVPVSGGAPVTLARLPGLAARGATWVDDQTIIIGTNSATTGLLRVPAGGGDPTVLTKPDREHGEEGHVLPSRLPGEQAVLFTIGAAEPQNAQIAVLDLRTGRRTTLLRGGRDAQYVASGHLVYMAGLALSAVRFDRVQKAVLGEPVRVMDAMAATPTSALDVAVTDTGTLVFVPGGMATVEQRSLAWVDRQGRETPIAAPRRPYGSARLSPDGTRIAVNIRDLENDIWTWDLARQTLARLTFDADRDLAPVWTPDGGRVVFASSRAGGFNLYTREVNGAAADVRLMTSADTQVPDSVTPDGAFVIVHEVRPTTKSDIVRYGLSPARGAVAGAGEDLVVTPFEEWNAEVSPDGRFLAYQSDESGDTEVYVRPYPAVASARWQVSSGGGTQPVWTRGGRELLYVDREQRLTAVSVDPGATFRAGTAERLNVKVDGGFVSPWRQYDATADGRRFLVLRDSAESATHAVSSSFVVVMNWTEELKRLVPIE